MPRCQRCASCGAGHAATLGDTGGGGGGGGSKAEGLPSPILLARGRSCPLSLLARGGFAGDEREFGTWPGCSLWDRAEEPSSWICFTTGAIPLAPQEQCGKAPARAAGKEHKEELNPRTKGAPCWRMNAEGTRGLGGSWRAPARSRWKAGLRW